MKNYSFSGSITFNIFLHLSNFYVTKYTNIKLFYSWRGLLTEQRIVQHNKNKSKYIDHCIKWKNGKIIFVIQTFFLQIFQIYVNSAINQYFLRLSVGIANTMKDRTYWRSLDLLSCEVWVQITWRATTQKEKSIETCPRKDQHIAVTLHWKFKWIGENILFIVLSLLSQCQTLKMLLLEGFPSLEIKGVEGLQLYSI